MLDIFHPGTLAVNMFRYKFNKTIIRMKYVFKYMVCLKPHDFFQKLSIIPDIVLYVIIVLCTVK